MFLYLLSVLNNCFYVLFNRPFVIFKINPYYIMYHRLKVTKIILREQTLLLAKIVVEALFVFVFISGYQLKLLDISHANCPVCNLVQCV